MKQEQEAYLLQRKIEHASRVIRDPASRLSSENMVGNGVKDNRNDQDEEEVLERTPNAKIMELQRSHEKLYFEQSLPNPYRAIEDGSNGSVLEHQMRLLDMDVSSTLEKPQCDSNDIKNAVLFSANVLEKCDGSLIPQYSLLGSANVKVEGTFDPAASRLFLNCNVPFSTFICGVQGSGKSHTTSCIIENCLIPSPTLGVLQKPMSALLFQWSENSSRLNFTPSEAAFLASPSAQFFGHSTVKSITVLASPSNIINLRAMYEKIPNVTVKPFLLRPKDLDISTILTLMSVDNTQSTPLYMAQITRILRDMATKFEGPFNYAFFRRSVDNTDFDSKQREFLNQRLGLLESFLDMNNKTKTPAFQPGTITILDLTCPFVDANTACVLFKIGLNMYLDSNPLVGKLLAVDEAHKYMTDTPASKALTESLLTIIRQQRHFGIRIILSTQEPTISPRLIDLCSMVVIHRFTSPDWFHVLKRHIPILVNQETNNTEALELFRDILSLKTGQALCFAPSAVMQVGAEGSATPPSEDGEILVRKLSEGMLKVRVRKRVTWDGGRSVVCL
ncbi:MAG: hypothetical protein MMC33_003979 [Icmadophila ericetorum]|nr:hypothetical protein [Icmadophila ericetorum]